MTPEQQALKASRVGRRSTQLQGSGAVISVAGARSGNLMGSSHFRFSKKAPPPPPVSTRRPKKNDVEVTEESILEVAQRVASCFRHPLVAHCDQVARVVLVAQHGAPDLVAYLVQQIQKCVTNEGCRRRRGLTRAAKRAMRFLVRQALAWFSAGIPIESHVLERGSEVRSYVARSRLYLLRIGRVLHGSVDGQYMTRNPCPYCSMSQRRTHVGA